MSYPPQQPYVPQPPQRTNGLAIGGFITSLLCCGPVGLILSIVGLSQINKDPSQGGKGLAIAGIVIGAIGLVAAAIYYFVVIALAVDYGY
ncbi:unannotated protein [freshwater metagenome]|uniref:Unannotated protein n=1 Tax=freshwater metagenome TaxID=449393 RepID=A0A6J6G9W3_9ZZZZ|nr:DUF4190 domain-containing protein [Actinomycetota bacterium]